jgi:hypothetical protein
MKHSNDSERTLVQQLAVSPMPQLLKDLESNRLRDKANASVTEGNIDTAGMEPE